MNNDIENDEFHDNDIILKSKSQKEQIDNILEQHKDQLEQLMDDQLAKDVLIYSREKNKSKVLDEEKFNLQRQQILESSKEKISKKPKHFSSKDAGQTESVLLREIEAREEAILDSKKSTIIYLRETSTRSKDGKEGKQRTISGYIDLQDRLRKEDFGKQFRGEEKLLPNKNDLSQQHFESQQSKSNSSDTFKVEVDDESLGLLFTLKNDRKSINVNPNADPGDNTKRTEFIDKDQDQVVIWDHETRRKAQ